MYGAESSHTSGRRYNLLVHLKDEDIETFRTIVNFTVTASSQIVGGRSPDKRERIQDARQE